MPIAFPSRFTFIFWGALQHSEIWNIRIKTGSFLVFLKVIIKDELHRMDRALLAVTKTSHNSGKFYVCKDSSEYRHSNIWEKYRLKWKFQIRKDWRNCDSIIVIIWRCRNLEALICNCTLKPASLSWMKLQKTARVANPSSKPAWSSLYR